MALKLRVLYFASLREKAGVAEEDLAVPESVVSVADLVAWLKQRGGGPAAAFSDMALVRVAVNQEHAHLEHPLHAGDEVAFFPPVTGG